MIRSNARFDAQLTIARATADRYDPVKQYSVADSPTWARSVPRGNRPAASFGRRSVEGSEP